MKILLTILCLITSSVLADPTPAYWWKITAADTTSVRDWGSNSNLTYQPSVMAGPTLITSNANTFAQFDGLSQYFEGANLDFSTCGKWACSVWLYEDIAAFRIPISQGQVYVDGFYLWFFASDMYGWSPEALNDKTAIVSATWPIGRWVHTVLYFDGSLANNDKAQIWTNGIKCITSSSLTQTTMAVGTNKLLLGRYNTPGFSWSGYMDDIRIYTNAADISTNLIPALYSNGPAPDAEPSAFTPWKFGWKWPASGSAPVDVGSPTAWWKMTETGTNATQILDFAGNNNATFAPPFPGGPHLITTNGVYYYITTAGEKFEATNTVLFNTPTSMSLSVWCNMQVEPGATLFSSVFTHDGNAKSSYYLASKWGASRAEAWKGKAFFAIGETYAGNGAIGCASTSTISLGSWYHMAATWDGGLTTNSISIYINGILENGTKLTAGTFTGIPALSDGKIRLGSDYSSYNWFLGYIDDIRYFGNICLSSNTIYNIFTQGRQ